VGNALWTTASLGSYVRSQRMCLYRICRVGTDPSLSYHSTPTHFSDRRRNCCSSISGLRSTSNLSINLNSDCFLHVGSRSLPRGALCVMVASTDQVDHPRSQHTSAVYKTHEHSRGNKRSGPVRVRGREARCRQLAL
jgi:hypothetical protein